MKHTIYLMGNITKDSRTFEWRKKITQIIRSKYNIDEVEILNPAKTEFDKKLQSGYYKTTYQSLKQKKTQSQNIFRAKDYQMIKRSSAAIVNLNIIDNERPIVGTIQELAWCHDIFYIPVIAIMGNNIYCKHPWILECISAQVKSEEEAVDFMSEYLMLTE